MMTSRLLHKFVGSTKTALLDVIMHQSFILHQRRSEHDLDRHHAMMNGLNRKIKEVQGTLQKPSLLSVLKNASFTCNYSRTGNLIIRLIENYEPSPLVKLWILWKVLPLCFAQELDILGPLVPVKCKQCVNIMR